MQGIEPKFHNSLTARMEYYRCLLKETTDDPYAHGFDIISHTSELLELYEDYLNNKKELEKSIKNYKQYHNDLRKLLTPKLRELKRRKKQK